jgi:hypothetical protein
MNDTSPNTKVSAKEQRRLDYLAALAKAETFTDKETNLKQKVNGPITVTCLNNYRLTKSGRYQRQ